MKTQRKNKNKLTKRSNKKNKQNKKTQKRKQSGGNRFSSKATTFGKTFKSKIRNFKLKFDKALLKAAGIKCKEDRGVCESLIQELEKKYQEYYTSQNHPDDIHLEDQYVRTRLCKDIQDMMSRENNSTNVKKYLNEIYSDICNKSSQNSINPSKFLD